MKITQREFADIMTRKLSIFAGITRNFDLDFIRNTIHDQMETIKREGHIVEKRIGKLHSNYIVFSGGSRLDLPYMEFHKVNCGNCVAYICRDHGLDLWNEPYDKSMVYVVETETE